MANGKLWFVLIGFALLLSVGAFVLLQGSPATFISQGTVESVSKLSDSYIVTVTGGSGADGITAEVSQATNPNWDAGKNVFIGVTKADDTYTYRLTERASSSKTVTKLALKTECHGNDFWNPYACNAGSQPFSFSYSSFKSYCKSLNANGIAISTGNLINTHWRCYVPETVWVVGDFNKVGGIYEPKVYVDVLTYAKGTTPWNGNGEYEKMAQVELDRTHVSDNLIATDGSNLGSVTINGMTPLFTQPPPSDAVVAVSPPTNPRQFALANGGQGGFDTDVQNTINQFKTNLDQAKLGSSPTTDIFTWGLVGIPIYEDYDETLAMQAINQYNAEVADLGKNNPVVGDFARSDIGLDLSAINSNGTMKIKNSFALPRLVFTLKADQVGVVKSYAAPLTVTCSGKDLDGGVSSSLHGSIVSSPISNGVIYWSMSCTTPVTASIGSGQVTASGNQAIGVDFPISTGVQKGTSICTATAYSTDRQISVSGSCQVNVREICNVQVPAGCHLKEGCVVDCTVPPTICNDGTLMGQCNVQNKRCVSSNGQLSLIDDASCLNVPVNNQSQGALVCAPFVEKVTQQTEGGFVLFGIPFGGTQVAKCVPDLGNIGIALIAIAGLIYIAVFSAKGKQMDQVRLIAIAIGSVGALTFIISAVTQNAFALALGGAGLVAILGVIVVVYLVLKGIVRI